MPGLEKETIRKRKVAKSSKKPKIKEQTNMQSGYQKRPHFPLTAVKINIVKITKYFERQEVMGRGKNSPTGSKRGGLGKATRRS